VLEFFGRNRKTKENQKSQLPRRSLANSFRSLSVERIDLKLVEELMIRSDFGVDAATSREARLAQETGISGLFLAQFLR
jgi:hypothetical protein